MRGRQCCRTRPMLRVHGCRFRVPCRPTPTWCCQQCQPCSLNCNKCRPMELGGCYCQQCSDKQHPIDFILLPNLALVWLMSGMFWLFSGSTSQSGINCLFCCPRLPTLSFPGIRIGIHFSVG